MRHRSAAPQSSPPLEPQQPPTSSTNPYMSPVTNNPPAFLTQSFTSSRGSRRSAENMTPPLPSSGPFDVDQVELQRLRAENQRNVRLLEEERKTTADLSRVVAELQRELDHIRLRLSKRGSVLSVAIPRFLVASDTFSVLGSALSGLGTDDGLSNASFESSRSAGDWGGASMRSSGTPRSVASTVPMSPALNSDAAGKKSHRKPYVQFLILVEQGFPHPPGKVPVLRRFNDFKALHKALCKAFPECPNIPDLPEKLPGALFSKSLSTAREIHDRRRYLEVYLKQILCIDAIRVSPIIASFFSTNVPLAQRAELVQSEEALVMDD